MAAALGQNEVTTRYDFMKTFLTGEYKQSEKFFADNIVVKGNLLGYKLDEAKKAGEVFKEAFRDYRDAAPNYPKIGLEGETGRVVRQIKLDGVSLEIETALFLKTTANKKIESIDVQETVQGDFQKVIQGKAKEYFTALKDKQEKALVNLFHPQMTLEIYDSTGKKVNDVSEGEAIVKEYRTRLLSNDEITVDEFKAYPPRGINTATLTINYKLVGKDKSVQDIQENHTYAIANGKCLLTKVEYRPIVSSWWPFS